MSILTLKRKHLRTPLFLGLLVCVLALLPMAAIAQAIGGSNAQNSPTCSNLGSGQIGGTGGSGAGSGGAIGDAAGPGGGNTSIFGHNVYITTPAIAAIDINTLLNTLNQESQLSTNPTWGLAQAQIWVKRWRQSVTAYKSRTKTDLFPGLNCEVIDA